MEQNLSLYRVFYTVANAGNISKAAEQLYISQPAISKSIRKLEQSLDVTLFSRNSRGVQLTEEGEILYDYVQKAFYSLQMGESRIKKINDLGIGQRQLVEILKGLSSDADLLIMDEPTASLSGRESEILFSIIEALRDKGVSIIYISHRLEEVYRLADRLTILRDGEKCGGAGKRGNQSGGSHPPDDRQGGG